MEQAGHRDRNEPNQDEITVSLFIKCLVLGEDSEYLNHNCKQKGRKGLGVSITSPPLLSRRRAPSPQHSMKGDAGCQTTVMGPRGARGLGRSGWCPPPGVTATLSQGSARSAVRSPNWSLAQANKGHVRRGQTSVPGVWGSEPEDCSPSSVRSLKRALSSGGYRKSA